MTAAVISCFWLVFVYFGIAKIVQWIRKVEFTEACRIVNEWILEEIGVKGKGEVEEPFKIENFESIGWTEIEKIIGDEKYQTLVKLVEVGERLFYCPEGILSEIVFVVNPADETEQERIANKLKETLRLYLKSNGIESMVWVEVCTDYTTKLPAIHLKFAANENQKECMLEMSAQKRDFLLGNMTDVELEEELNALDES